MNLSCKIQMPPKAAYVIGELQKAGYEAYIVGGCVRDCILGEIPQDWDITTSATPEQVKSIFYHTIDTGIEHGTVTVMVEKEGFEVTTYRIDGKYEDGRHPTEVIFTPSLYEDLRRRDFTINAMAYNEEAGIVDLFHGLEDLQKGIIRCVGDPKERFGEDALRMMRAVRFAAKLGYEIEPQTKETIKLLAGNLKKISAERIQTELVKLVCSDHPQFLRIAYETGITAVVLPEFDAIMQQEQNHPHHMYSVGEHTLVSMQNVKKERYLRLAMLFHDMGKPLTCTVDEKQITHFYGHPAKSEEIAKTVLKRLKFDNDTIRMVCKLVYYHDYKNGTEPTEETVRRAIYKIGEEAFPAIFEVQKADILAQSMYMREEKLKKLEKWQQLYDKIKEEGQCVSIKMLAINGSDLIAKGMKPGREIGETLEKLLDTVLSYPEKNTREYLLSRIEEKKS